jgi:hypothetical protein
MAQVLCSYTPKPWALRTHGVAARKSRSSRMEGRRTGFVDLADIGFLDAGVPALSSI